VALSDFLGDALNRVLKPLIDRVLTWLGPFGKIIQEIVASYGNLLTLISRTVALRDEIVSEIAAWKNFRENIAWRTRVINLKTAYDKTNEFIAGFTRAWRAIVDLIKDLQRTIKGAPEPEDLAAEGAEAVVDEGGISGLEKLFPKLAKFGEKLLGVVLIVLQGLEGVSDAINDFKEIVDQAKAFRLELEQLDTVFLSQGNKRKVVTLTDGTKMKIRVGKLHS